MQKSTYVNFILGARASILAVLLAVGLLLATTPRARGGTYQWNVGDGSWATASNWTSGTVPGLGSTVILPAEGNSYSVTLNYNYTTNTELYYLLLSGGSGGTYITTLFQGDGTKMVTGIDEDIGYTGSGQAEYNQSGGSNLVGGNLVLGYGNAASGEYVLSGDAILTVNAYEAVGSGGGIGSFYQAGGTNTVGTSLQIGSSLSQGTYTLESGAVVANQEVLTGVASFMQESGTNTVDNSGGTASLYIGDNSSKTGAYQLDGGTLSADNEFIGYYGTGTFTQTGGNNGTSTGVNPIIYIGTQSGDSGAYTLSGTGSISATRESVGYLGSGKFIQQGGSNQVGLLYLGGGVDSSDNTVIGTGGSYELDGGTLSAGIEDMYGSSSFTQTGGTNTTSDDLHIGGNSGGNSVYALSGDSTVHLSVGGLEEIGRDGTGSFIQDGGTNTAIGVYLGSDPGSSGSYTLTGGTLDATDGEAVNYLQGTSGMFTQEGGSNSVGTFLIVGGSSGGTGAYELDSGQLSSGLYEAIGNGGTFTQKGGTNTVTRPDGTADLEIYGGGSYELDSGAQLSADNEYIGTDTGTPTASFVQKGGTNTITPGGLLFVGGYADGYGNTVMGNGSYELDGGSLSAQYENIGTEGTGVFTQNGGNNGVGFSSLDVGSTGTYNLNAGLISVDGEENIYGTFNHIAGSNTVGNYLYVTGTYNLSGTGTLTSSDEYVSGTASSSFVQEGGTNTLGNNLYVGGGDAPLAPNGIGSFELDGGELGVANGTEYIGFSFDGSFTQTGGTNTTTALEMGFYPDVNGTYSLSGSGILSAEAEQVGVAGSGSFTQTGGSNIVSNSTGKGTLIIGDRAEGSGSYELDGGTLSATYETIGNGGVGSFTQTTVSESSSNTVTADLTLGAQSGSSGTYNLEGGTLSANNEIVGSAGSGAFTQTGGSNSITLQLTLGGNSSVANYYVLNPASGVTATLSAASEVIGDGAQIDQYGGTNTVGSSLQLGDDSGAPYPSATYFLFGGNLMASTGAQEIVGYDGNGADFDQTGERTTSATAVSPSITASIISPAAR
jgi:hypothetical protein